MTGIRNTMDVNLDNDTLKAKIRSCNILNTFYHETLLEIDTLSKTIYKRDNVIADLKARLGKYENTWINVEGYDHVVIEPSKSLLESLCKEICKLKQKWKDAEMNTAKQAELSQKEIQRLRQQLREKERELESVTRQPDHEKDQVIQRLRSALAERDRARATRAVLCTSLAEEADQLRGQLGATVRVCQELLGRLEGEKKGGERVTEEVTMQQKAKEMSDSTEAGRGDTLVSKLQEENQQLKRRVAYVEGLNSKWQKYDSSREEFVRSLCQRLNESSALAAASSPAPGVGPRLGPGPTQEPGAGLGLLPGLASANAGFLQQEIDRLTPLSFNFSFFLFVSLTFSFYLFVCFSLCLPTLKPLSLLSDIQFHPIQLNQKHIPLSFSHTHSPFPSLLHRLSSTQMTLSRSGQTGREHKAGSRTCKRKYLDYRSSYTHRHR
uniref:TNFAIP3 interacting protein 2 n=1 Tax=Hucho hucho TaxID=62062 RepID=A0A4W5R2S9_9TELE